MIEKKIKIIKNNVINSRSEGDFAFVMNQREMIFLISNKSHLIIKLILDDKIEKLKSLSYQFNIEAELDSIIEKVTQKAIPLDRLNETNRKMIKAKFTPKLPTCISLQLTEKCNLFCSHCFNKSGCGKQKDFSKETAFKIIDEIEKIGIFELDLTGGETLLYKDLYDVINYAKTKKISVDLNSNGMILTENKVNDLKRLGIYSVRISLDGNELEHNQMRGNRRSFKNAVDAITLLKNKELNPEIFFVPTKKNKHCLPFIMEFGKQLGVKVNVRRFMPYGRGAENIALLLSSEDVADLFHMYEKYYYGNSTFDKCYTIAEKRGNCKLCIQSTATININGDVFSCPFFQEKNFCLGNINDNSLKDILGNLFASPLMTVSDDKLSSKCQKCDIFSMCRGGCRGSAYVLSGGDIYSDDPQCAYQLTKR